MVGPADTDTLFETSECEYMVYNLLFQLSMSYVSKS